MDWDCSTIKYIEFFNGLGVFQSLNIPIIKYINSFIIHLFDNEMIIKIIRFKCKMWNNILNNYRITVLSSGSDYPELENNGRKCYKVVTTSIDTDVDAETGIENSKLNYITSYYNYYQNKGKYDEKFAYQPKCPFPQSAGLEQFVILTCAGLAHFIAASIIISQYNSTNQIYIYNVIGACVSAIVYFAGILIEQYILDKCFYSDWEKTIWTHCKINIFTILIILFTSTCMFISGFCLSSDEEGETTKKLFLATLYGNLSLAVIMLVFLLIRCIGSPSEKERTDAERRDEHFHRVYSQFVEAQRLDEEDSKNTSSEIKV